MVRYPFCAGVEFGAVTIARHDLFPKRPLPKEYDTILESCGVPLWCGSIGIRHLAKHRTNERPRLYCMRFLLQPKACSFEHRGAKSLDGLATSSTSCPVPQVRAFFFIIGTPEGSTRRSNKNTNINASG